MRLVWLYVLLLRELLLIRSSRKPMFLTVILLKASFWNDLFSPKAKRYGLSMSSGKDTIYLVNQHTERFVSVWFSFSSVHKQLTGESITSNEFRFSENITNEYYMVYCVYSKWLASRDNINFHSDWVLNTADLGGVLTITNIVVVNGINKPSSNLGRLLAFHFLPMP